ncbi:alpha/beta fold hydrolase [Pseudonocardia zijingensis]|uniref:Alpha/beta fold hydrolase n=1 Tax=Pseudonocardia zijingensis TaxID=153376 RepID=A0ABN1NHM7_9PSEU
MHPTRGGRPSLALSAVLAVLGGLLLTGAAAPADVRVAEERVTTADGVELDTSLYLPATTPAPAVLVAHGFGGSKASVDADARALAARGFVVLTWSARGFGTSTGQIALDSPDHEVADARALVDRLAGRPDVVQDAPGDPRVGVTGASYGGALALLLAGLDPRVDALAPVITWNNLGQALFPNAAAAAPPPADTPAHGIAAPDGVFKSGWAGLLFSAGRDETSDEPGAAAASAGPANPCGRFTAEICAAYTEAATTGRISPATAELLRRSSPATVADRITAPTLLVQGEQDTLFGLDQADATARQITGAGGRVKVEWFAGGHDGAAPAEAVRDTVGDWFDFHLAGIGDDPGTGFSYVVPSGVRAGSNTPTSRTLAAPAYPGLPGAAALLTTPLPLEGDAQEIVHPAGGRPAAITSLPGLGGALGSAAGRISAFAADPAGQSATFRTPPLEASLVLAGAPRVQVSVARVPGQPAPAEAVLFARVTELDPDGRRTLLGGAVAPMRVPVPADGTPATVTVTLPGLVAPVESGNRLAVSIATTDQGFTSPVEPAVWQVDVTGDLIVPVVPGTSATASTVPLGPLVGIAVVLAIALLGWMGFRLRRRRATAPVAAEDGPPLRVSGLAKTYAGGFQAVKDVSFTVEQGIVLGLLGPNGAGKTTVLRMLMGLVRPTAGTVSAFGQPIGPGSPVLARIGAFVEGPGFLPHLSGADNLRLYWAATGRPAAEAHVEEALEIADLGAALGRRVGTYSQGMRQRLAIAQAMLGLPDLLVLDEPTNGLDPPQISAMREVLRRYAARGRTVVVSSHLLAEVEQTCTHVVVMHRGEVVADGTVEEIIAGGGAATFTVDAPERAASVLSDLAGVLSVEVVEGGVHAELNGTPRAEAVRALVAAGVEVAAAGPRRRLEDAFLQLVGEDRTP